MKTTLLTLLAATLFSGQAMANDLTIHCHFKEHPSFGVWIKAGPFEGNWAKTTAPAEFTTSGPRLYQDYPITLQKTAIQTRTIIGVGYYADLGWNSSITLTDIKWAPAGWEKEVGFTGIYIYGGHEIALVCE